MRAPIPFQALALTWLCALACRPAAGAQGLPNSAGRADARAIPTSRLAEPERIRWTPRVVATGTLRAPQQAILSARLAGTLTRVAVARGQTVEQGALLVTLDDRPAKAAVRRAESVVGAASVQLGLAEDALRRVTEIGGEGGATAVQLVEARARRELAAQQHAAAQADLVLAQLSLEQHTLRAPFAGVVTKVPDGVGATVTQGSPLVTLVGTGPLVLDTTVTQREWASLRIGTRATVTSPAIGATVEDASVTRIVAVVDPSTERVPVEFTVPNPDGRLLPNAFARAEAAPGSSREAWRLPAGALVRSRDGEAVWGVDEAGEPRAIAVHVLAEEGATAVLVPAAASGWPAGARVLQQPPRAGAADQPMAEARR